MASHPADLDVVIVDLGPQVDSWAEVYNTVVPERPLSPEYLRHVWQVPSDCQAVMACRGDRPLGVAQVEVPPWSPGSRHAEVVIGVPSDHRGAGVGTCLYHQVSGWAAEKGMEGLDVWVEVVDDATVGFWERRGFVEVEREENSVLDLAVAAPDPVVLPDGVVLVTLAQRPDADRGMFAVCAEVVPDIPGAEAYEITDFELWRAGEIDLPGILPDCSVIALAGDQVVGYTLTLECRARPGWATTEMTGVSRAWRGKGIALALKRDAIRRARRRGICAMEANNEARNAPMLAVNRRLGFVPVAPSVMFRGPLATSG